LANEHVLPSGGAPPDHVAQSQAWRFGPVP
jgi:hypothetical protein